MDNFSRALLTPHRKWLKTQVVRISLYYLGMAIQTAYRHDPEAKKCLDSLPDNYTFCMGVENGPTLLIQKSPGSVRYVGEKDAYHADLELRFKNIEYGFLAMTGFISTPNAVYHHRQYVKGNLNHMMVMLRAMNIAQTLIFPNTLARFYIKEVPRLTLRKMANRVILNAQAFAGFYI